MIVADDNAALVLAISDLVAEYPGVEVVSRAMDVTQAVRSAIEHRPDLALVDAWLTGGGAELATRKIKSVSPATTVAALASGCEDELALRLKAAGALGCYDKYRLGSALVDILAAVRGRTGQRSR